MSGDFFQGYLGNGFESTDLESKLHAYSHSLYMLKSFDENRSFTFSIIAG